MTTVCTYKNMWKSISKRIAEYFVGICHKYTILPVFNEMSEKYKMSKRKKSANIKYPKRI